MLAISGIRLYFDKSNNKKSGIIKTDDKVYNNNFLIIYAQIASRKQSFLAHSTLLNRVEDNGFRYAISL
jgi:hypothetical protein